jgi:hypothetical protein
MTIRSEPDLDRMLPPLDARPRVFVESGTFHGKTTRWAVPRFPVVHTIEWSPGLHARAVQALAPLGVTCHHGDSRQVIPALAASIAERAVWFLDAHWLNNAEAAGNGTPLPLSDELTALAARPYLDTIIVDDVASFGHEEYQAGWGQVSLTWIARHFPGATTRQVADSVVVQR